MSATSRGKGWEIGHSLWIFWSFWALLGWIPFFYIGIRSKNRKWVFWGIFYATPLVLFIIFVEATPSTEWLVNTILFCGFLQTIMCIVHSFLIRKEYLMRLDAIKKQEAFNDISMRRKVDEEFGLQQSRDLPHSEGASSERVQNSESPYQRQAPTYATKAHAESSSDRVDLNAATEQTLAGLPGVGVILAKKAVSVRNSRGDFRSTEDFFEALNLRSHTRDRIRPLVFVAPSDRGQESNTSRRIVDF